MPRRRAPVPRSARDASDRREFRVPRNRSERLPGSELRNGTVVPRATRPRQDPRGKGVPATRRKPGADSPGAGTSRSHDEVEPRAPAAPGVKRVTGGARIRRALTAPTLTQRLQQRFFRAEDHPYRLYEAEIARQLRPEHTLLDAGCGRSGEVVRKFRDRAARLIGVDLGEGAPDLAEAGVEYTRADMADTGLPDAVADVVISRAVIEHLVDPDRAFGEVARLLRPGGAFVALAPSLGDYVSLISKLVPNRLHPWIVKQTEGRAVEDTFPAYYRANTRGAVRRVAAHAGLELESFRYLGQYPAAFMFNPVLFLMATGYEKVISRFETLGFLRGWYLAVMRKPGHAGPPENAPPVHP